MNWLAACALSLAVLVLIPGRSAQMRRFRSGRRRSPAAGLGRLVRGHAAAMPNRQRVLIGLAAGLAAGLLIAGDAAPVAGLAVAVCTTIALGWLPREDPAQHTLRRELPDALDLISVCVEAGAPTVLAIDVVAGVSPQGTADLLETVSARLRIGTPATQAWAVLAEHPVWGGVARDLARSARSGTSVASALRVHADEARRRRHELAITRARAVGVKSVMPLMLCFLPAFIAVGVIPIIAGLAMSFF